MLSNHYVPKISIEFKSITRISFIQITLQTYRPHRSVHQFRVHLIPFLWHSKSVAMPTNLAKLMLLLLHQQLDANLVESFFNALNQFMCTKCIIHPEFTGIALFAHPLFLNIFSHSNLDTLQKFNTCV